jgi:hypothetical protein
MATAPRINYFDGSGTTTSLTITTNATRLVFTGEVDDNIVDIQINVNGAGFTSDPSLVDLSLPDFTVPNLTSFPDGIELELGQNTIELRAQDVSGQFSPVSTIVVRILSTLEFPDPAPPPTGVKIQRNADSVQIGWSDYDLIDAALPITGFNIYASTGPGGTQSGYLRINKDTIPITSPTERIQEVSPVEEVSYDIDNPQPGDFFDRTQTSSNLIVNSQIQDAVTNEVLENTSNNSFDVFGIGKIRLTVSVEALIDTNSFSFIHNRNDGIGNGILNSDSFSIVDPEDPLFYVLTTVTFDKVTGQTLESRFSQEIAAKPLPLDTTVRGIRVREQANVVQDYITEIQLVKPKLSLIPASTVREVHVEPFANEIQKAYFLMDFVHRAKSFAALLQIDDPNYTGESIPVANSAYKQNLRSAMSLSSDAAVQALIDGAFDSLAQNFGTPRLGRRPATVNQTFYTTTVPTKDLIVSQDALVSSSVNSTAPRFRARGSITLPANDAQAYFNPDSRRYEVKVQLTAETPGSVGNLAAGDLDTIVSGADGFQTVNDESTAFGRDVQSNLGLAEDAVRALSSVDAGTEGGYQKTAIGTPGLQEVRIVQSGDEFMMRDYDEVRGKHIGGKVDIWVKGDLERTVSEKFSFQFQVANSVRFDVINATNLILRARDSRLTEDNPIAEMLFNPSQNLGLRNQSNSPTTEYDLTGVVLLDYRTIQLSGAVPQPSTLLDDFVEGDYRFRSNNKFTATLQPIRRVVSVVGEVSGTLDATDGFTLFKIEDPLLEGESTRASDNVEINQVDDVPSGASIPVSDEQHVMIGQFEEPLDSVGINTFTLKVFDANRLIEYKGPDDVSPDYLVIGGSQTTPLSIVRTSASNISNGATISVDYEHDENFTVTYVVNDVLQQLQRRINNGIDEGKDGKHVTADVLVKQALENPLLTEATAQLEANGNQSTADSEIRTNLTVLTDSRGVGGAIRVSDMVKIFEGATGLDFVVQPFTKMTLSDGAIRIRDGVPSDAVALDSLSQFANRVYIMEEPLPFDTLDGGGDTTIHHGVFMDELITEAASSLEDVGTGLNKSWIIGRLGAVIEGYSDDATLEPEFITESAIEEERIRRTANRIVISLNAGLVPEDVPENHSFAASYVVSGDRGVKSVETSQVEFLTPGDLTITYRTA